MGEEAKRQAEQALVDAGFGGLELKLLEKVATLSGALPDTDEALAALEAAWDFEDSTQEQASPAS